MLENFNNQKIIGTSIYDNKPTIKEQQKDYWQNEFGSKDVFSSCCPCEVVAIVVEI